MIKAVDSEFALLGAAMYQPADCGEAFERVRGEHFSEPVFGRMWDYMRANPSQADPVLVYNQHAGDEALEQLGGLGFLARLVADALSINAPAYADAILDAATRRELDSLGRYVSAKAQEAAGSGEKLLAEMERAAAGIARYSAARAYAAPVGIGALDMLETAYSGGFQGSSVGLESIDKVTGGIHRDDVWFIGGRTSMGKSVMGCGLARGIAQSGRGVLMFSLEMPMREVQSRLIADIAYSRSIPEGGTDGGNVRYGDILKGRGSGSQRSRAITAAKQLASLPISVNDQGGLSIEDIRAQSLRQVRSWEKAGIEPGAILIDHIGLVKPHERRNSDSKAAETADIVNELKGLAKQVGAPVIALVQVNRNTEARNDKRPTLADLNWSGAIEQIADFICLLYRPAYYLERGSDDDMMEAVRVKYDLEMIIAKNRSGPICQLKAFADVSCNAIRDIDPQAWSRFG